MEALVNYKLIINDVIIHNNMLPDGKFLIDPQLHRSVSRIDDNNAAVTYVLEIKNTNEKPFPVDILVSITGIFDISNLDKKDVDNFLNVQSCQIIFPLIRTIVANLTSSSLMPPILLPIIDARKAFNDIN